MYNCVKCGVSHDYTDGFKVALPGGESGSACWRCYKALGFPKYPELAPGLSPTLPAPPPREETWRDRPPML